MNDIYWPWLELAILSPLLGALCICWMRDAERARKWALVFSAIALVCALAAGQNFIASRNADLEATETLVASYLGLDVFTIDELNAPLLTLTGFLFFLTTLATPQTQQCSNQRPGERQTTPCATQTP